MTLRLLLVGAFAYPHDQGSQVYFQEQAIALRSAGAEVELLTYGAPPSAAGSPDGVTSDPARWRALDGFRHTTIPARARPAAALSGPNRAKPLADLALARTLRRVAHHGPRSHDAASASASSASNSASRSASSNRHDAILAHHVEAAAIALASLPRPRPPIVFCPHTLLEEELPLYFKPPDSIDSFEEDRDSSPTRPTARRRSRRALVERSSALAGRVIERLIARRADAWIALTQASERVIQGGSPAPGARIAPPIADPRTDPLRLPPERVARAHGLEPDGFFLYTGNLDPYQDLPLLASLARVRGAVRERFPIVVATHDPRALRLAGATGVRVLPLARAAHLQALVATARATLVPRRARGGFPIKLANSLAAGTPVVALHGAEWGLVDGRDALIGELDQPVASLAAALDRLERDPDLAGRLGSGARATWAAEHAPERVAAKTLALLARVVGR